jgi:hypothetical protein
MWHQIHPNQTSWNVIGWIGSEALEICNPWLFCQPKKSWELENLISLFSLFLGGLCLCVYVWIRYICVCLNWPANGACITSIHLPPKPGQTAGSKWAAPIAQRAWPGGPGRFSTRPFSKLRCAPSLPSKQIMERHWHTFCDILLYALGVPTFHIPWPPWEWTPPQSWNDHVAQRWAAAALPVGVVALRRSPRCGNAQWPRCPQ